MYKNHIKQLKPFVSRRDFLMQTGGGLGAVALAGILADDGLAQPPIDPLAVRAPHFAPKAKRIIQLFMNGGPSHLDTFDYKPDLTKYAGQPIPGGGIQTERKTGAHFCWNCSRVCTQIHRCSSTRRFDWLGLNKGSYA